MEGNQPVEAGAGPFGEIGGGGVGRTPRPPKKSAAGRILCRCARRDARVVSDNIQRWRDCPAVKARMVEGEVLLAFLDDVYVVTTPFRMHSTDTPGSRFTVGKRRCGTQLESILKHATHWSGSRRR